MEIILFFQCSFLTSVTIPNSVTSIGVWAFSYCRSLTSITIPNSVTSIRSHAFYICSSLVSISIPTSVTSIGNYAFGGTKWYDGQPDGLVYAGLVLYKYKGTMPANTNIIVKNGTTGIGAQAFFDCKSLTSITIPSSVTSIGSSAFSRCAGLTSIIVEKGNTKYDSRNSCNAIIETQTNSMMAGCKNTIIPNSVTSIGDWAFNACRDLKSIIIPNSVTTIGKHAFSECSGLTSITIPNSVTSIGESAFYMCSSLTYVTIPNSVTSIEERVFTECRNLEFIFLEENNKKYDSRNDCNAIIETESNTLIAGCKNTTIPESITSIGDYAFNGCRDLKSIIIPNSVTNIGERVFENCTSLTSITIPNSVTSIRRYAFCSCEGLTSITIPNSVTSIGEYAICGCTGLTSFTIPNSVTSIGSNAFLECTNLASITIPNSVTSIGESVFENCASLTSITIPNSVTSIGGNAFGGTKWFENQQDGLIYAGKVLYKYKGTMPSNTKIAIKEGTTGIAGSAFQNCSGLTSVTIPNSVTSIEKRAFSGCSGLTSVTIPNSVTSIEEYAFSGCSGLTSVTCEATIPPTCGSDCFYNVNIPIPVYVPANSVDAYKKADGWKDFTNIQEIPDNQKIADAVVAMINAIDKVEYTDACKEKIEAANNAYNALTADQKALVTNFDVLTKAQQIYETLKAAAEKLAQQIKQRLILLSLRLMLSAR